MLSIVRIHWIDYANGERGYTDITHEVWNAQKAKEFAPDKLTMANRMLKGEL